MNKKKTKKIMTARQRKKQIDKIVDWFIKSGFSHAELERSLDLKRGTLRADNSPELLALLKILLNFPWIIRVAEKNFDEMEAKKAMYHTAIDLMFTQSKNEGPRVKQK